MDLGKGIGGGSLINGMCWTRGGSADYDAWVALGNPGWGWNDLLPYFKRVRAPLFFVGSLLIIYSTRPRTIPTMPMLRLHTNCMYIRILQRTVQQGILMSHIRNTSIHSPVSYLSS